MSLFSHIYFEVINYFHFSSVNCWLVHRVPVEMVELRRERGEDLRDKLIIRGVCISYS